jgi:hypothetical protein
MTSRAWGTHLHFYFHRTLNRKPSASLTASNLTVIDHSAVFTVRSIVTVSCNCWCIHHKRERAFRGWISDDLILLMMHSRDLRADATTVRISSVLRVNDLSHLC